MNFDDPHYLDTDMEPIDLVEYVAETHDWDFDRIDDNQIAMGLQGQWRKYSVTLAWSEIDQTLRMICTFELDPPEGHEPKLFELFNHINDMCWAGSFNWWKEQKLIIYRYGLILSGDQQPSAEQIDTMINAAVASCERFYPAIVLVLWCKKSPQQAMQTAIAEAYGTA